MPTVKPSVLGDGAGDNDAADDADEAEADPPLKPSDLAPYPWMGDARLENRDAKVVLVAP